MGQKITIEKGDTYTVVTDVQNSKYSYLHYGTKTGVPSGSDWVGDFGVITTPTVNTYTASHKIEVIVDDELSAIFDQSTNNVYAALPVGSTPC